jgi:hypothetical protein
VEYTTRRKAGSLNQGCHLKHIENRVNKSGIYGTYMGKSWYFNSRMSFETDGNCCQMLLNLLKLSRSSFFEHFKYWVYQGTSYLHIF